MEKVVDCSELLEKLPRDCWLALKVVGWGLIKRGAEIFAERNDVTNAFIVWMPPRHDPPPRLPVSCALDAKPASKL
jgi:hypothetical protein